jgi:hypothetical protein
MVKIIDLGLICYTWIYLYSCLVIDSNVAPASSIKQLDVDMVKILPFILCLYFLQWFYSLQLSELPCPFIYLICLYDFEICSMFLEAFHKRRNFTFFSIFLFSKLKSLMLWKTLMGCPFSGLCLIEHDQQIQWSIWLS